MKLSTYIKDLQNITNEYGDIDCVEWCENDNYYDSTIEGKFVPFKESAYVSIKEALIYTDNHGNRNYYSPNEVGYIDGRVEKVFEVKRTHYYEE
jgi:hypothetical protein